MSGELWNEIQLKGPRRHKQIQERNKRVGKLGWFMSKHKPQHPHHEKVSPRGQEREREKERERERERERETDRQSLSLIHI